MNQEDAMDHEGPQNKIIQIDEALVKRELGEGAISRIGFLALSFQ